MVSMGINTIALVLILIGKFSNTIAVKFTYVAKGCTDTDLNYTKGIVYENNLGQVLSNISSKSSSLKFYNYTVGDVPDKVYGLFQCRDDVTQDVCSQCVVDATIKITRECPLYSKAIVWYYECMLGYANRSIFFSPETLPGVQLRSTDTVANHQPSPSFASSKSPRSPPPTVSYGILGAIAAGMMPVLVFICIICWMCIRGEKSETISQKRLIDDNYDFVVYDFADLEAATKGFSKKNKLGEGAFGIVYKGTLKNGTQLAIKRLSKSSGQSIAQFMPEARLLGKLRHKNLVKLLGFCITKDEKLLAYELMPNGSLEDYMFVKRRPLLDWTTRYNIIKGIASGLLYLHESSPSTTIIHRDQKLDNILLDEKMIPKIADFGLAKLFVDTQVSAKTYQITGTFGYMSPEYMNGGKYSNKSDVFAFGIMLLEIVSGQSNLKYYQTSGMGDLPSYAWRLWKEDQPSMFIDAALFDKNPSNDMVRCVQIGLLCTEPSPKKRPNMSSVIFMLSGSQKLPLPSSKPAFSFPATRLSSRQKPCGFDKQGRR